MTRALSERIILITGAANGIGAAIAEAYAQQGLSLILLDKDVPALETLYDTIVKAYPNITITLAPMDLKGATIADYQNLIDHIGHELGHLDGLVHCAAELGQIAPVGHQHAQQWAETMHVNLTAAFLLTQACLPLIQQSGGIILFTTDSHKGEAYWSSYGISKAGIDALAQQLRQEFSQHAQLYIDCIDPGQTRTNLFLRAFPGLDPTTIPEPNHVVSPYVNALEHFST